MPAQSNNDLERLLKKYSLQNALKYNGKANENAVLGKVLAEVPELRENIPELKKQLGKIVDAVNDLSTTAQHDELEVIAPELLDSKKGPIKERTLPELSNVGDSVVMRFAPGPSGPLHIGHARAAILNDEYCKKYDGKLILRLEDTNPAKLIPEAYDWIKEDLDWLGVKYHDVVIQSERFDTYYKYAEELIEKGHAYICTCDVEDWRKRKDRGKKCKHRDMEPTVHLENWQKMLNGGYKEGEASYIVKTDLSHPNPAIRDFIAFRIIDKPLHPRTKDKYRVYPLMNFTVALDDHLLGLTHVLRGKDHLNNTYRQGYLYKYFGWPVPEYIHYGWVSIEGTILKTSEITKLIASCKINDWRDARLGTFRALERRGILPEAVRRYWIEVGTKEVDVKFSWDTLYAYNRELADADAPRYFFVYNPVGLSISGIDELVGKAPIHPEYPERGYREYKLSSEKDEGITIYVSRIDWNGLKDKKMFRLKDLCNVEPAGKKALKYSGNDTSVLRSGDVNIVQWVSNMEHCKVALLMPDGEIKWGLGEIGIMSALGKLVQLERIGYAKLSREDEFCMDTDELTITAVFAHK